METSEIFNTESFPVAFRKGFGVRDVAEMLYGPGNPLRIRV